MKKRYLLITATAVALVAGTRAARYLQLQRERPPIVDATDGYVIPEDTQPVVVNTSIGEVKFGPNHKFQPRSRAYHKGNALFVYFPAGYGFGQNDEHSEYVLRLSLALQYATNGHFRMEPVPHIAEGGDPNASAIISAGTNYQAWGENRACTEPRVWIGTPMAYKYYMGDDPTPNFDQTVKLVTWLIGHPKYVAQACTTISSLIEMANLAE